MLIYTFSFKVLFNAQENYIHYSYKHSDCIISLPPKKNLIQTPKENLLFCINFLKNILKVVEVVILGKDVFILD